MAADCYVLGSEMLWLAWVQQKQSASNTISVSCRSSTVNRVNAFIVIVFALALTAGFFIGKVEQQTYVALAAVCIGFFFPKDDNNTPQLPK